MSDCGDNWCNHRGCDRWRLNHWSVRTLRELVGGGRVELKAVFNIEYAQLWMQTLQKIVHCLMINVISFHNAFSATQSYIYVTSMGFMNQDETNEINDIDWLTEWIIYYFIQLKNWKLVLLCLSWNYWSTAAVGNQSKKIIVQASAIA